MEGWLLARELRYLPLMENLMKSILDPTFHYVPSVETDLKKTFSRIRRELEKARAKNQAIAAAGATRIIMLNRPKESATQR
jgi:hypothetical protein